MAGRPEIAFLASMADTTRTEAVGPVGAAPSQAVIPAKRFFNSEAGQAGIALQRRMPIIQCSLQKPMDSRFRGNDGAGVSDALPSDSHFRGHDLRRFSHVLPSMARQIHTVCKESSS